MDVVIAGQILAGLTALILWQQRARPTPALIPARVQQPTPRRARRDDR